MKNFCKLSGLLLRRKDITTFLSGMMLPPIMLFLIFLKMIYRHFPQLLHPLQINLLPQVSQFARKWGTYKSSCGIG